MQDKIHKLYRRDNLYFYTLGALGFMVGFKICDWMFYDEKKYLKIRESMEEEYWKIHGEPKHVKPDIVESLLRPG